MKKQQILGVKNINVIYVDVLFGVNMFVHYFLLLATSKICKKRVKFFRMLLGSFVATIFTAVIFLPEVHFIFNFFIRLFISGIVIFSTSVLKIFQNIFLDFFVFIPHHLDTRE